MTLEQLVDSSRSVTMTDQDREAQRRSFAYGNTKIENELITRETIDRAAKTVGEESRAGRK